MKRIIIAIVAIVTVSSLTGCANKGLIHQGYDAWVTPEPDICKKIVGHSTVEAEKILDMGKVASVEYDNENENEIRTYTKGNLQAKIVVGADGKILKKGTWCRPINK